MKAIETALALIFYPLNIVNVSKFFTCFVIIIIIVYTKFNISSKTVLQVIKKKRTITREWLGQVRLLLDFFSY